MNDLAVSPSPVGSEKVELITKHLAQYAEASARCQHALSQNWTLRELASKLLGERLEHFRSELGLSVSNPDAIFFNHRNEDGQLCSMALTDLLIDVMRGAAAAMEVVGAAFYVRHNTLDPQFAMTDAQNQEMKDSLKLFARILSESYQAHLSALWRKPVANPENPEVYDSTSRIVVDQQRHALQSEIELRVYSSVHAPAEQALLADAVAGSSTEGLFQLSWVAQDDTSITVPSAYIASASTHEDGEPAGVVFLILPGRTIERFESVNSLREALSLMVADPGTMNLEAFMVIPDQAQLADSGPIEPDAWRFDTMSDPLVEAHVQAVQHKQMHDCQFLLEQPAADLPVTAFHEELERVRVCAHLDDAMGQRFNVLATEMQGIVEPHWRKYAKPDKKEYLLKLESAHRERKQKVDTLLGVAASLESFAYEAITAYIREHLGCFIDPDAVQISAQDTISLGGGEHLAATYHGSLLEFAVRGLPGTESLAFSPAPSQLHAEFSEAFVREMLAELDLHRSHDRVLFRHYTDEQSLRLITHHRDSAIALGAWAALMQGHMVSERSHEMLHFVRGDIVKSGAVHSIGSLHLTATHTRFRDLIVFEEKTQTDEYFILYAPGAPKGQDFFEFGSWRQLCIQVGDWLATHSGNAYVHDQLATRAEARVHSALKNTLFNLRDWGPKSCTFVRCTGANFESNLSDLVRQKAFRALGTPDGEDWHPGSLPDFASPSNLALVQARIQALNTEFARLSPGLVSLRDYVHQQTSDALNQYLKSEGYEREIDPDTLFLGLGLPWFATPDFSEYSQLRSLTDLMMYGDVDILSHRPQIHLYSSVGLDTTKLPRLLIQFVDKQVREADLGARYMDFLKREFLGRRHPLYSHRRALMSTRIQHEMISGALTQFLKGNLTETQYSWLRRNISGLSVNRENGRVSDNHIISPFRISGRIIEGVYVFRGVDSRGGEQRMLYTPAAPDDRAFRPLTDYAELMESASMRGYYAARGSFKAQSVIATFLEELHAGGKYNPDFIRIDYHEDDRILDAHQLYDDMIERMIADTDSQTESIFEKRLALAWTVIRWTGTVLLLPFPTASIAWGVLTSSVSIFQGIDAYVAGDRAAALPLLVFGVLGFVSGGDAVRAFTSGGQTILRSAATSTGRWVWRKLEFDPAFIIAA